MDLIDILKREHRELLEQIKKIKREGIISNKAKENIFEFKNLLLKHLRREDDELYPFLNEVAKKNVNIDVMLRAYKNEINKIEEEALMFFNNIENKKLTSKEIEKEFDVMVTKLKIRIISEEKKLFPKYSNLKSINKQ